MNAQHSIVAAFYDRIAPEYDRLVSERADYVLPKMILAEFCEQGFDSGRVLDIGCGSGRLRDYLERKFEIYGIELSARMAELAANNGYKKVVWGAAENHLRSIRSKSFDHVVALSSLYLMPEIEGLVWELERIARKSVLASLEQFDEATKKSMQDAGIKVTNHSTRIFGDCKIIKDVYLWTRPLAGTKIYGHVIHKVMKR